MNVIFRFSYNHVLTAWTDVTDNEWLCFFLFCYTRQCRKNRRGNAVDSDSPVAYSSVSKCLSVNVFYLPCPSCQSRLVLRFLHFLNCPRGFFVHFLFFLPSIEFCLRAVQWRGWELLQWRGWELLQWRGWELLQWRGWELLEWRGWELLEWRGWELFNGTAENCLKGATENCSMARLRTVQWHGWELLQWRGWELIQWRGWELFNGTAENCFNGAAENCFNGAAENCSMAWLRTVQWRGWELFNGAAENCFNGAAENCSMARLRTVQ